MSCMQSWYALFNYFAFEIKDYEMTAFIIQIQKLQNLILLYIYCPVYLWYNKKGKHSRIAVSHFKWQIARPFPCDICRSLFWQRPFQLQFPYHKSPRIGPIAPLFANVLRLPFLILPPPPPLPSPPSFVLLFMRQHCNPPPSPSTTV